MSTLETFFLIQMSVQLLHSIEELTQGFHRNNFFVKMSFLQFLAFEIVFTALWVIIFLARDLSFRSELLAFFMILMFANGVWHITWSRIKGRYVPGLITAFLHVISFLAFYFVTLT